MDPIAPVDYERWAVMINPFPVPSPHREESKVDTGSIPPIAASVPAKPLGYFSEGFDGSRYAHTGTGGQNGKPDERPHPSASFSPLTSGTTDSIFRILLQDPGK